jgi:glycosyltransferase involved in cell wall biosynthesis
VYAGSVTGLYMLEEMGKLFIGLKAVRPGTFFRILTAGDPGFVRRTFAEMGIGEADFSVQKATSGEVLNWVSRSQVAISFRKPTFSQIAASPTKIGEYLACGIPVIVNSGIGDIAEQVNEDGTGVVIDKFEQSDYAKAIDMILDMMKQPDLADKCRAIAKERFDLSTVGGPAYRGLYKRLLDSK